uniref:Reverse transcriptase zinc-binding domain-containing protein n=1 Tax=Kalanchoe fedtschenkoi TaxID=63787 RepID=A0A7N0VKN2_KALFE
MAWRIIKESSPWASFMAEKYKNDVRTGRSNLWKQLMPIISDIKRESIIFIGSGECKIWEEPWCIPPLSKPPVVSFTGLLAELHGSNSVMQDVMHAVPEYAKHRLREMVLSNTPDRWVWTGASDGEVSVRAFVRRLQQSPRPRSTWNKIWLKEIPNRINAFLWKLQHGVVTVDSFLKAKNIPLASKCRCCCEQPQEETINHLFARSEVARRVWRALGLGSSTRTRLDLRGIAKEWFDKANQKTRSGMERILLFSLGIWEIWKYRCATTFGEINSVPPDRLFREQMLGIVNLRLEGVSFSSQVSPSV